MKNKKYQEKAKLIEKGKIYSPSEAFKLVKETGRAKFDESVDLALKLGLNAKKGETVRGTIVLPGGSGKKIKVAVIAKGDKAVEAEKAGADVVGGDDLAEKIKNGFFDFDILLTTPDMMGIIGRLAKLLGPKGLMPNPKSGTITQEIGKTVSEFKAGKIEFRTDKDGNVHLALGKVSFPEDKLAGNFKSVLSAIIKAKPSGVKGNQYIRSIALSSTMGPGIKVSTKEYQE